MIKLGVIGSTNGTDLQAVLDAIAYGELVAKVSVVISNNEKAHILDRAKNHDIPAVFIPHRGKTREEFDNEMTAVLKNNQIDLILLIGFMRILSSEFCLEWQDRLLNVHPSLLPKYGGRVDTSVHEEVLKNGDAVTGCTIHFVTEDVDGGPILIQKKCDVVQNDTIDSLKTKVQALEGRAFIEAIQLIQKNSYVR
jgi:formyltetrahydrofolate-dependent phosphoribosylglycinamide formyltransferase